MSEKLKPCPFCGSALTKIYSDGANHRAVCCACEIQCTRFGDKQDTINAWNTRSFLETEIMGNISTSILRG